MVTGPDPDPEIGCRARATPGTVTEAVGTFERDCVLTIRIQKNSIEVVLFLSIIKFKTTAKVESEVWCVWFADHNLLACHLVIEPWQLRRTVFLTF